MASLKDIKQKIKGVSTTQQITRAMKMMSTARLGRAIEQINLTHSYISKLEQIVRSLNEQLPENYQHPFIIQRPVKSAAFVVVSGERGLCGGFNYELNKFAAKFIEESEAPVKKVILIGKKSTRFFRKLPYEIVALYEELNMRNANESLFEVADQILNLYQTASVDSVYLIYTAFISPTRKYVAGQKVLPLDTSRILEEEKIEEPQRKTLLSFDFEPSPTKIFDEIIPRFLRNLLHRAIIESSASEQSARMAAMTSATDRAQEIIDELQLDFNRNRQALITREIAEVISGSEA
ncbi:MAG: F0F1 ATP synthase subunit gamma [Candidatus Rifleibacteriota bacterium]